MYRKKCLFVFNPHSGKEQIKPKLLQIIDIFTKAGYDVTAYPTQAREDGYHKVIEDGGNYDHIVCSGGDGTLDETVSGILKANLDTNLGYIPAGSTNDFAHSLGIPKDMVKAADIAVNGEPELFDIGDLNGGTFVYVAAFGVFTDVSYQTDQGLKNMLGHAAYILEGAKRLNQVKTYKVKVTIDDEVYDGDWIFGMVSNSKYVGGMKVLNGRHTKLDDGVFEITLIKAPKNPIAWNETLGCLILGEADGKNVIAARSSKVTFEFEDTVPWTVDGEYGGEYKEVTIKNLARKIALMVKPHK
ncbi:MAG: diacylglycerol kinase family lipid kinase [Lachnospiraceae bacterium]|nr:diacylglycerol kinase family lipid kinase [Lachnospiraceae bacterium]MBO4462292.1 diacylglycerol kinase family lipid kinase [Lachnospiraceae bacterium]